ncbi:secretin and TonB N-terminal domain-containing protein [Horticoccus luteus]|uniref:Secretin and TonB N-terminal domain-containing protein n=1 Tax=Horticoccus luteus TaxID=2862869 RepID=A0A8F9XGT0_9BACT|nr:secretin N-terminal domain-containing protein [Horticoccus luteus]QYM79567.1 secretin and TonB N-terminal domain-containing protein [Horticoccus luteus]
MSSRPLLTTLLALTALSLSAQPATPAATPVTPVVVTPAPAPVPVKVIPASAHPVETVTIKETAAATPAVKSRDAAGHDTLSVDFPDTEIRDILRNVADLFELNVVIPDTLQGKTSIKLRDVSWRQIFQVVLAPVNFTYVEDGNIIKIISLDSLQQEPVATEVFMLNYARASDLLASVSPLIDAAAGGRIVVDARSNSLVITERPSRMNRIRPILEQLDRATDQVMIESKFVEVTDRDIKNIGVNWASLAGYNITAGGAGENGAFGNVSRSRGQSTQNGNSGNTATTSGTNNSSSSTGTNGQSNGATTTNTVTSTGGIVTSTGTTSLNTGLTGSTTTTTTTGTTGAVNDTFNVLQSLTNTGATDRALSAVFSADQFKLVLSALQSLNTTKIVSNPTIVTLNNTEASINVGEERPIPNYSYSEQKGTFEVSGFTFKPIGVLLKVTPQVNGRGFIKLSLSPEVSQPNGSVVFGGASGTEIPIIATRRATTQVSLKDGYTMGIGGLLTQNANTGQTKVPVLGSIPLVGRLFRSDSKDVTTSNLIIFITAKTISADGAPVEEVFSSQQVRQLEMKREDLPGYRDGADPFVKTMTPAEAKAAKKAKQQQ